MWAINAFFDSVVYLNTADRTQRDHETQLELKRWNITAERVEAIPANSPLTSFNKSFIAILDAFVASDKSRLLVLEDDVVFNVRGMSMIDRAFADVAKREWSQLYLGGNLFNFNFRMETRHLARVQGIWTTHAVGFSRAGAQVIAQRFRPLVESGMVFDDWLAHHFHPHDDHAPVYLINPMAATQRPNHSDLLGEPVDYSVCWKNTNNRLNKSARTVK